MKRKVQQKNTGAQSAKRTKARLINLFVSICFVFIFTVFSVFSSPETIFAAADGQVTESDPVQYESVLNASEEDSGFSGEEILEEGTEPANDLTSAEDTSFEDTAETGNAENITDNKEAADDKSSAEKEADIDLQGSEDSESDIDPEEDEIIDYFAPECYVEVGEYQEDPYPEYDEEESLLSLNAATTTNIKTGYVQVSGLNVRKAANTGSDVIGSLSNETIVILGETKSGNNLWYKITDGSITGYACGKLGSITYITDVKTVTVKADLSSFPASYRSKLTYILALHPNFTFVADPIKYTLEDAADWHTGYKVDMPSRLPSSYSTVKEYMDPVYYMDTTHIFAFAEQYYNSSQSKAGLKRLFSIGNAFLDTDGYISALLEAGKKYNVSPYVLAATILSEKGWSGYNDDVLGRFVYVGTIKNDKTTVKAGPGSSYSNLGTVSKGKAYIIEDYPGIKSHSTGDWYMILYNMNGRYVGGYVNKSAFKEAPSKFTYYKTYYNLFSINQTDDNVVAGGVYYAMTKGWDTPYKSLVGGAVFYKDGYIDNGQDTYYYKDYNVANPQSDWWHEYAGAVDAVATSARILSYAYAGDSSEKLTFRIPVYKGVSVKKIALNKTSASLATKKSLKLSVTYTPSNTTQKSLTWKSSNPSIAKVDGSGNVTALRYGTATITATSADNSSVKATCKIQTRYYDVNSAAAYYYKPVYWAADKGITKGYDNVYFGPKQNCTRREMMIFLWRIAGKPEPEGKLPFSDTDYKETSDSYKAICWGAESDIIDGYSDGTFRPDDPVNRKDTLIMIFRLAGEPETDGAVTFPDVLQKAYAPESDTYRAILWGTGKGITHGYTDGSFKPDENCLREHIVTFLYRYAG